SLGCRRRCRAAAPSQTQPHAHRQPAPQQPEDRTHHHSTLRKTARPSPRSSSSQPNPAHPTQIPPPSPSGFSAPEPAHRSREPARPILTTYVVSRPTLGGGASKEASWC